MIWDYFIYIGVFSVLMWIAGAVFAWKNKNTMAILATMAGVIGIAVYIALLWGELERPPMRTMGETRLWYSLFLPLAGVVIYGRWHYKWIFSFTTLLATVFVLINILKPEIHSKNLMPALQSPWFAPHVIVYMMAYALLGAAFAMSVYLIFFGRKNSISGYMPMVDNMVHVGYAFLTFGILMGAVWAKAAWGHYWSWDPKETWAAVTWFAYLGYIHYRLSHSCDDRLALVMLIINFCLLQMCWWGINYLPSAQGSSIHTYSMSSL